ncbi:hypothetical protein AB0N06_25720 [Streptomyces sp. NPDC051020]|uniref:hypothetical protein n=1 Tax=Streptomyces sp. NPDC051020 TaxID=3155409 RepID=UPI0034254827
MKVAVARSSSANAAAAHVSCTRESQLIVGWGAEPSDVARRVHAHPTRLEAVGEDFLALVGRGLRQQA